MPVLARELGGWAKLRRREEETDALRLGLDLA